MPAKQFVLVASVQHILELAKNRLELDIVSETIDPEAASTIQAELKERFEERPTLAPVEPLD